MKIEPRTLEEQQRLSAKMRDPKVIEHMFARSLLATPASPDQVQRFLVFAPPEIPILIKGLTARAPGNPGFLDVNAKRDNERIVAGLVGALLALETGTSR